MMKMRAMSSGPPRRGQHINEAAIKAALRGPAGRVPAADFWRWMQRLVADGTIAVAQLKGKPAKKLGSAARQRETAATGTAKAHLTARRLVEEWVEREARVHATTLPMIKPAMVETMSDVLKRPEHGITRQAIQYALIEMAAQGKIRVEHVMGGVTWTHDIAQWAVRNEWVPAATAESVREKAGKRVTYIDPDTLTLIELGSGWEGATEGLKEVIPRVVTVDDKRQSKGAKKGSTVPELRGRFNRGKEKAVRWVASKAGVSSKGGKMLWASVSCKEGSVGNSLGKTKKRGRGVRGGQRKNNWTTEDIDEVVEGIEDWEKAWGGVWVFEDPKGSAVHRDPAVLRAWQGAKGVRKVEARGCCYGTASQRPYELWTNLTPEEWTPVDWMIACKHCRHNTQHPETWAPRKGSGSKRVGAKEGFTGEAIRNRIPRKLAVEVAVSMLTAVKSRGLAEVDV